MAQRTPTRAAWLATTALVAVLTGCAGSASTPSAITPTPTPTPTPAAACPEMPGVDLPPECVAYDPDAAMAQNDRYRERLEMTPDDQAGNADAIAGATAALESVRTAGAPFTEEAVRAALESAGIRDVQVRADYGRILFGAGVSGGCVYGSLDESSVTVELGGYILDGGCLPAQ